MVGRKMIIYRDMYTKGRMGREKKWCIEIFFLGQGKELFKSTLKWKYTFSVMVMFYSGLQNNEVGIFYLLECLEKKLYVTTVSRPML